MLLYINIMELEIKEKMSNVNIVDENELIRTDDDGFKIYKNDLTDDNLLTAKALLRKEKFLDNKMKVKEETIQTQMTKKVIRICLCNMGLDFMANTYNLTSTQRKKLQTKMKEYEDKTIEEINIEFNEHCNEYIFDNPKLDYSKLPVYSA